MPPKELQDVKWLIGNGDNFQELGEIGDLAVETDSCGDEQGRLIDCDGEFSITIENPDIDWGFLIKRLLGSNNWRKMHGLPMISRKKYRKNKKGSDP